MPTVLGKKTCSYYIQVKDGPLLSIVPDRFYDESVWYYFQLEQVGKMYKIVKAIKRD